MIHSLSCFVNQTIQLAGFGRCTIYVNDFNAHGRCLTACRDINKIINIISAAPGIQGGQPASGSRVGYVKFSHPADTEVVVSLDEVNDLADINDEIDLPFDHGKAHDSKVNQTIQLASRGRCTIYVNDFNAHDRCRLTD